jgi:hypothetical protein
MIRVYSKRGDFKYPLFAGFQNRGQGVNFGSIKNQVYATFFHPHSFPFSGFPNPNGPAVGGQFI